MPHAPADDQLKLLDVQDADLRIQQARHKQQNLPVIAQIEELTQQDRVLEEDVVARATEVTDLKREVQKAEDDVQAVRARADRDQARLAAGDASAKDLQALQAEVEILAKRQGDLEDVELEAMERLEAAERDHAAASERREDIEKRLRELAHERDVATRELEADIEKAQAEREAAAAGLDAGLLSLYERLRDQHGGIGAAALQGSTCLGCHMTLNPADVRTIEAAAPDAVVRCEECGRILVRKAAA